MIPWLSRITLRIPISEVRMRARSRIRLAAIVLSFASAATLTQTAPPPKNTDPNAITVTVTVITHGSAAQSIDKGDVVVHQANKVRPVLSWEPVGATDPKLDLVVVVDDSLTNNVATRWNEVASFLTGLPAGARTAVAYANRGTIQLTQQPTTDHALAAKTLRNPAGVEVQDSSIYESIQTLIDGWPSRQGRRVILLVSSGYDAKFSGVVWDDWPTMQKAIEEAQRKGVVVYSIYAKPFAPTPLQKLPLEWGQEALNFLSRSTGGEYFNGLGFENALSFQPYLQKIQQDLSQQYLLTFQADLGAKPGLAALQVAPTIKSAQFRTQARVLVPAAK
jgi:hypothetical protein